MMISNPNKTSSQYDFLISNTSQRKKWQAPMEKFAYSLLEDLIDKMTLSLHSKQIKYEDLENIFLVTYKIDEKLGPSIHKCTFTYENNPNWDNILHQISSIFYLAIGQGSAYHTGLFGPFPVVDQDMRALVYASFISDEQMTDPRLAQHNYYLITLIFPRKISSLFYEQQKLTKIFQDFVQNFVKIENIDVSELINLRNHIIDKFFPFEINPKSTR